MGRKHYPSPPACTVITCSGVHWLCSGCVLVVYSFSGSDNLIVDGENSDEAQSSPIAGPPSFS
jgi:hypothetical protein